MSIGQQFLARLNEAKEKKTFEFDKQIESMKRAMREVGNEEDLADKIAEVFAMCGLSGTYINKAPIRESVIEAAMVIRSKTTMTRTLGQIHSSLSAMVGVVLEAKGDEVDLDGGAFQQLVEEVLVELGLPAELVGKNGKAAIRSALKRQCAKMRSEDSVRIAFITFAKYAGIKVGDDVIGSVKKVAKLAKPVEPVKEAVEAESVEQVNVRDLNASARMIFGMMGLDLADEKLVRVVNDSALSRSLKAACRDAKVKRAMLAFLRAAK